MPITGKKCSFTVLKEVEGNKKEVPVKGEILSEPFLKTSGENTYMAVPCIEEGGQCHEVAFFRLQIEQK